MANYTSIYSGTDIDDAITNGLNITGGNFRTYTIASSSWYTSSVDGYLLEYEIGTDIPVNGSFDKVLLSFYDSNNEILHMDCKIVDNGGLIFINVYSNAEIKVTVSVCT